MIEERQQAYLEAMNIPVWVARKQPETPLGQQIVEPTEPDIPATQPVTEQRQEVAADSVASAAAMEGAERPGQAVSQGLKLGPGSGGVLLVCGKDSDSASKLGNDITRVLPNNPVWAWPDSDDNAVVPLEAVNENLFTCVAVFGDALAQLLFDKQVPPALGSATVVILPAMSELENNAGARRKLWSELCRSGMIVG